MSATEPLTWNNVSAASKNTTRIGSVIRRSLRTRHALRLTEDNSKLLAHLSAVLLTNTTPPASFEVVNKIGELVASTIFVIDSSPAVRRMVEQISTPAGFDVIGFQDGPAALEAARRMSPTLIITDYHLDNMTFSGFCKEVHKLDTLTDTYIIALTGASDKFEEGHLKSLGVKAFLKKPFQSEHLLDLIKDLEHTNADKT